MLVKSLLSTGAVDTADFTALCMKDLPFLAKGHTAKHMPQLVPASSRWNSRCLDIGPQAAASPAG